MKIVSVRTFTTALSALLLVALLAIQWVPAWYNPSRAFAQQDSSDQSSTKRSVSVTGSAQVRVQLDLAIVRVGVQTSGSEAAAALDSNSEQMQALLDALQKAGVAEDDIQTQTIQLQPQYANAPQEFPSQPQPVEPAQSGTLSDTRSSGPEITGYIAINTVEVRTSDLANLGSLLDEIVAAGGNQIAGIRFDISNANDELTKARDAAWQDARQKAEQLAKLSGGELGDVLTISEFSRGPVPLAETSLAARDTTAVPVQPGTQDVGVDLQVTWQLQ
ncbi:MAG: SIMPL domain-containing protein [Caldilineaceae bacterium]